MTLDLDYSWDAQQATVVCLDPAGHAALEANPAQEKRFPPLTTGPGHCKWCGRRIEQQPEEVRDGD